MFTTNDQHHESQRAPQAAERVHISSENPTLVAALDYAKRGWRVIPLYYIKHGVCSCPKGKDCRTPAKHPSIDNWVEAGTTDAATIRQWWQRTPQANVGICTGVKSGIVVLDIDPRHGGNTNLEELIQTYEVLPETPMVLTGGGGQHYYFACSEALPACQLAPGIDFQSERRMVVAPPSVHASGRTYLFELSADIQDMSPAQLSPWMRALALDHHSTTGNATPLPEHLPDADLDSLQVSDRIKLLIRQGEDAARYPSRSEAVMAVISALIAGGHDDATIASVLLNPAYGISSKPLSQKDPRSPRYLEQTRHWVAQEIARARAKRHNTSTQDLTVPRMYTRSRTLPRTLPRQFSRTLSRRSR